MSAERIRHTKLAGLRVAHLGALDAPSLVLVLGRSNDQKKSVLMDQLADALRAHGHSVCWHERRALQCVRLRREEMDAARGAWLDGFTLRRPVLGRLAGMLVWRWIKFRHPKRHGHVFRKFTVEPAEVVQEVRRLLSRLKAREVRILGHSSGGLVAALVEGEPRVWGTACLGYPLKHPDQTHDEFRTSPLRNLRKPFLIIQGSGDEYGAAQDILRQPLSPHVRVESVVSGHDYDTLDPEDARRVVTDVVEFFSPSPGQQRVNASR